MLTNSLCIALIVVASSCTNKISKTPAWNFLGNEIVKDEQGSVMTLKELYDSSNIEYPSDGDSKKRGWASEHFIDIAIKFALCNRTNKILSLVLSCCHHILSLNDQCGEGVYRIASTIISNLHECVCENLKIPMLELQHFNERIYYKRLEDLPSILSEAKQTFHNIIVPMPEGTSSSQELTIIEPQLYSTIKSPDYNINEFLQNDTSVNRILLLKNLNGYVHSVIMEYYNYVSITCHKQ